MTRTLYIGMAVLVLTAGCTRRKVAVPVPPPRADTQLTKAATPVEVYPATTTVPVGERRLFFARIISPQDKQFRFDSDLFEWKVEEADGGVLRPLPGSKLYYLYTAPLQPGQYHLKVTFKENARFEASVLVKVEPDPASLARKVNGSALPE